MLDPDYLEGWTKTWALIKPSVQNGDIVGIFLGDEHMYFGVQLKSVKTIADLIRLDWPEAII